MSSQRPVHPRVRRGDRTVDESHEPWDDVNPNGNSSTAGNASDASARDPPDYSVSGFVWRDPKPPIKKGVE